MHVPSWRLVRFALALGFVAARPVAAQTDYYNLDAGRPLRVEDALVIERHALEWQLAPVRYRSTRGGGRSLGIEPELAWGALPRTQLEVGVPLLFPRGGKAGGAGVEVTALHALNAETGTWPGIAIRAGVELPAGPYGPREARGELAVAASRTLSHGRVHANASFATAGDPDDPRWVAGLAADHTFVLRSMLIGAELVVEDGLDPTWSTAMGMRYQVGPRSAIDLGVGRTFGPSREWFVTMGSALSFGLLHRLGGA